MSRLIKIFGIVFFILVIPVSVGAASLDDFSFEITDEALALRLQYSENVSYRIWTTKSPAKVIIDAQGVSIGSNVKSIGVDDVALKGIRVSRQGTMARVVMDFKYQVPTPEGRWDDDGVLSIEIPRSFDDSFDVTLGLGVKFFQSRRGTPGGPVIANWLEIDPRRGAKIIPALAQGTKTDRETVSSMSERMGAIAGVNGIYFASDGEPLGLMIIDGQLVSSPYFGRTAFGVSEDGFFMDQVDHKGTITIDDRSYAVSGVNRKRFADEIIIYTPDNGATTGTNSYGVDLIVRNGQVVDVTQAGNVSIPQDGFVISAHGTAKNELMKTVVGTDVVGEWRLVPEWLDYGVTYAVGGGPRLVRDGQIYITGQEEKFRTDITVGRAPRTALGVTSEGKVLLVTINGRREGITIGMTLTELAKLMIELGAVDAMNLDGGGSTTMVVRDRVLNLPSDGRERLVSNALLVFAGQSAW